MIGYVISITQGPRIVSHRSRKRSVFGRSIAVKSILSLHRIGALLLCLILSNFAMVASISAATITVGTVGDPTIGNAAKCDVASTCTLRDAITKAAAVTGTSPGDTIVFNLPANTKITLSGNELLVDKNLTIDGSAVPGLAINGGYESRVFRVDGGYFDNEFIFVDVTLKSLVIEYGMPPGNLNFAPTGGGIFSRGNLILEGCTIANNAADGGGGGIMNGGGNLTLIDSSVTNNFATNAFSSGGGIGNVGTLTLNHTLISGNSSSSSGGISNSGAMTLIDSTISSNTANNGNGGGIANGGTMTLIGSTISNNKASADGGGVATSSFRRVAIISSKISGNIATAGSGGGIANIESGILTLSNTTVADNTSGHGGGGLYNDGDLKLTNSTVSSNTANFGGGIFNNLHSPLTLINSTITENKANNGRGGAIYNRGPLTLTHGTLAGNISVGANGDVYNNNDSSATASATNTIIQSCALEGSSTKAFTDYDGNLDGGSGCGFTSAHSKSNAKLDLRAFANNGGPTLTMIPGPNSDAIGQGVTSACINAPINNLDQRGYIRSSIGCASGAVDPNGSVKDSIFFDGFGFGGQ
jgi:hypothetical protein